MNHIDIKKQIETWRERRAEKLMARLSRQTCTSTPSNKLSPYILGIKAVPSTAQSNGKQEVMKQKPYKKGPLEVRQTKSSSLRFQLANPLLDVDNLKFFRNESLLTTRPGDVTNDKEHEKRYTFADPRQKSAIIEQNKTPTSKLLLDCRVSLNESFTIPNLNNRKNLDKIIHSSNKLNDVDIKTDQTVNRKQTDKMRHVGNGKNGNVDKNKKGSVYKSNERRETFSIGSGKNGNVDKNKKGSVYKSNERRETFSIGSSYNETVRKAEVQHFEENYCNKIEFNDTQVCELLSDHNLIMQTEHNSELKEAVQNVVNNYAEHSETDMQSETNKRRETFNIDLINTTDCNNTEPSISSITNTISEFLSDKQKKSQNEGSNVNKPHILRKSLDTTNVKNSPSYQNLGIKRNSKSLSTINRLTKSNTGNRKQDSIQRPITALTSLRRKPEKVAPLQRALTYSHINENKSLPSIRRQSFIISRKHDIFSKKMVSPISEESSMTEESLHMSTPKPKENCNGSSNLSSVKSTPYHNTLKRNLVQWLTKRNKSVNGYRHLQCFLNHKKAVPVRTPLSNKKEVNYKKNAHTNVEMALKADYISNVEDKENIGKSPNKKELADSDDAEMLQQTKDALTDLRRLILEGYGHDECERWLHALHSQNHSITDLVEYWECVAALEETRGDIKMAVDSYQRAIIRGAEVESINEDLNRLFDKMILLNINPTTTKPQTQTRTYVDPRNIFSSTVIRFALQQKAVKKLATELEVDENRLHYLATPVRRTTRVQHKTNPNCVRSLSDLEPEIKNYINFKPNPAFS